MSRLGLSSTSNFAKSMSQPCHSISYSTNTITRVSAALPAIIIVLVVCAGCHTSRHDKLTLDDFQLAVAQSGIAVGTLKALDAGDTNRAYNATLLHLKDSVLRMRRYLNQADVPPEDRVVLKAVSLTVLRYVEQQKEKLGENAPSDHCALEVTKALADTLTDTEDLKRVQVLHDYFSSRFVEERRLYE